MGSEITAPSGAIATGLTAVTADVFGLPAVHTGWNAIVVNTGSIHNGRIVSSGTQNDEINFDLAVPAGTWTLELMHTRVAAFGIYTVTIDGAAPSTYGGSADTIDGYAASTTPNVRTTITGIVLSSSAVRRVKLKMATKNASSTGYTGGIQGLRLVKTA